MTPKQKAFALNALRRASFKWKPRKIAEDLARVENPVFTHHKDKDRCRVGFRCAHCDGVFRAKEKQLDHIERVGSIEQSLDILAERMYPGVDGWQVLCIDCHQIKTWLEEQE